MCVCDSNLGWQEFWLKRKGCNVCSDSEERKRSGLVKEESGGCGLSFVFEVVGERSKLAWLGEQNQSCAKKEHEQIEIPFMRPRQKSPL
jgi:hypothetical protein